MKIALLVHCFFPRYFYGTEAYALALAKEFIAAGHEATVISANFQGDQPQVTAIERRTWEGVPVVSIDKNAWPHGSVAETYDQPNLRAVYDVLLRSLQPDILHVCHLINHTLAAVDAASALDIPIWATLTDFFGFCLTNKLEAADGTLCIGPNRTRSNCIACHLKASAARSETGKLTALLGSPSIRPFASAALASLGRAMPGAQVGAFKPADIITRPARLRRAMATYKGAIAPSNFLMGAYRQNEFPAPIQVSHFGIDIDRGPKRPRPGDASIHLGYVGQLAPHKGPDVLLTALRMAGQDNLFLTIWGDEAQDSAYAARLRQLAGGLNVTFAGTVPRESLAGVFAQIDALVVPSLWYENSPLILLQALATHTPVIVSDVEGLTEFIEPGRSGLAFPRGDVGALARVLGGLATAPGRLAEMSLQTSFPRTSADMARDVLALYAGSALS